MENQNKIKALSLLWKAQLVLLQMPRRSVTLLKAVGKNTWRTKIKTVTVQTSTRI